MGASQSYRRRPNDPGRNFWPPNAANQANGASHYPPPNYPTSNLPTSPYPSPYPPPAIINQQHHPYPTFQITQHPYPNYPTSGNNAHGRHEYLQRPPVPATDGQLQQTSTIRNAVNLKKTTLKLVPKEGNPDLLEVHFMFDSSAPCSVTTFFLANENITNGCEVSSVLQPPGPRVNYSKGLGLKFPPEGNVEGHALSLPLYNKDDLMKQEGDKWPLIIRLETAVESKCEGRTLNDLKEGSQQPPWVQSQTTFAVLSYVGGGWSAKVIRQKIWVDSVSYELQEIYGIETEGASQGTTTISEMDNGSECVICMTNPKDTTVLPCRHMCMCSECANHLRHRSNKCPICREIVDSLLHIKLQSRVQKELNA